MRPILTTVVFTLVVYILIGLPLAVLPGVVHFTLGRSLALAGFMVSLQYVATLATRQPVGRIVDGHGPKWAVLSGLGCAVCSGFCVLAASHGGSTGRVLFWLGLSRVWLGAAESGSQGCITWAIGLTGAIHTGKVISWNGAASYGGIALGAPVGVLLYHEGGLAALGSVTGLLALAALALCALRPGTEPVGGARLAFHRVFWRMLPYGSALALGSVGFGTIVSFITLFYARRGWTGAAYALSAFGLGFVAVRFFGSGVMTRFGGFRVSFVSFAVEIAGLLILWLAFLPGLALLGATLTGLGMSLIFPAIAIEALKIMPASSRGAAISAYTVFLDICLGGVGPLAGLVIAQYGYRAAFLLAAIAAAGGGALSWRLYRGARAAETKAIA